MLVPSHLKDVASRRDASPKYRHSRDLLGTLSLLIWCVGLLGARQAMQCRGH